MAMRDVSIEEISAELPAPMASFLTDADERIERFYHDRRDTPIPGFVPSDFVAAYATLAAIRERQLSPGMSFCEWGSGFGVVACVAAMLGYDACGIEIEHDLVTHAQTLAMDHELGVTFVQGSFIPEGGDDLTDTIDNDMAWLAVGQASGYDELGLDADDFDVVFAYPWPGEEWVVEDLFERYGARGALLVTYRGREAVKVQRKA